MSDTNAQNGTPGDEDPIANSSGEDSPAGHLQAEVERLNREMDEMRDRHLRAAAELDNVRRRMERERQDLLRYANENVLKDLMPVLDSFDKAIGSAEVGSSNDSSGGSNSERDSARAGALVQGMMMVRKQLMDALAKHGLEEIKSAGSAFDPNFHQAIQRIESKDIDREMVQQEFAKGYLINGRLLRAAMVSVAVPKS